MKRLKSVFITGATGQVGSYLLKVLLEQNYKVFILARSTKDKTANNRAREAIGFWSKKALCKNSKNIIILEGDLRNSSLSSNRGILKKMENEVEEIYHCAASTKFNSPLERIRAVNVVGTKNVLDFAKRCKALKKVNYVSTAFVCGNHQGVFKEKSLDLGQGFNTAYEQSKFEGEKLANAYRHNGLWIDFFRPVLVVGDSKNGKTITFNQSVYQLLHMWNLEIFESFPIKNYSIKVVFVDDLCKSIFAISSKTSKINQTYHTFNHQTIPLEVILKISSSILGFREPKATFYSEFLRCKLSPVQKMILQNNILLYNTEVQLDARVTKNVLKRFNFSFSRLNKRNFSNLITYAIKSGFLRKK
ncbi:SDR family oxidoreductase [Candidatus Omnitrophota bacterium]